MCYEIIRSKGECEIVVISDRRFFVFIHMGYLQNGQTNPESSARRQSFGAIQLAAQRPQSDKVYHT
ncbi:hypothetical protein ACFOHW_07055 [Paenibacillus abyssi]|uniref:hypothetical protein n=1 Tax=Paenibacillus abyssi TaxID=1340531 RepID=UPI0036227D20